MINYSTNTVSNCITTQQLQQQCSSVTLQKITQALLKKAQTMAGIFKLTPPSAHLISTLRLKRNRVNGTATEHRHKRHVSTRRLAHCDSAPWGKEGGREEGKKRNRSDLSVPSPTSCFNPLSGTSYITVPLFHLERDADFKQRLLLLRESKSECAYNLECFICIFTPCFLL